MYSLALIIFVVSEKKAFEYFPLGSNVNLCSAVAAILNLKVFCSDMKFKMAATAGLSLTLNPMGKMFPLQSYLLFYLSKSYQILCNSNSILHITKVVK
jgi:hypothetical protein